MTLLARNMLLAAAMVLVGPVQAQERLTQELQVGVQESLVLERGLVRLAIADDSVVNVRIERAAAQGQAARLLLTPIKPGTTSLMVWTQRDQPPQSWVLHVRQAVQVRQPTYGGLTEMDLNEKLHQAATAAQPTPVNAGQVQTKSNVVQVDVKVVELNKTRLQQAGLNLFSTARNSQGFSFGVLSSASGNPQFNGQGGIDNVGSPFSQAFGLLLNFGKANLGLNLGVLESNGMARVLAEPSLLAISGQSANFLAGGEVPIPVAQGNGAINIEYKPYGVGLTVSPTVLDNQRIVLKVAPESSELDYANAVTLQSVAVPAITTRKADTTVELGDGESFVIGGLVSQSTTSNVNKVPLLGDLPILGMLFKRQEFSRRERELVIVVTPRLVKPFTAQAQLHNLLPGAAESGATPNPFWGAYIGPGGGDALPGFSP